MSDIRTSAGTTSTATDRATANGAAANGDPGNDQGTPSARALRLPLTRGRVALVPLYVPLCIAAFFFVLPFLWMLSGAFKDASEIAAYPPRLLPGNLDGRNFSASAAGVSLWRYFGNSLFVAVVSTIGTLVCSSMAAFAFAHLRSRARRPLFATLLATMMLPPFITLIPSYAIYQELGWLDSYLPLTVPSFLGVGCAFYIFLLRQFFLGIPKELFEAARIDGAGRLRQFVAIALPLSRPALITVGLFQFVASWNDFFGPLIFLTDASKFTLPVAVNFFQSLYAADYGRLLAVSCVTVAPVILLFLIAQKFFVQGIATTGGKT
ncbi:carbohydrate ABC transporter permease [Streptomyces caelestis]|jgi:ABC-type glycerol-3-phosphate transport system permease component|uniref:ABC-type glycerol-3-phosphate transport system permease component n=1 Tax=Streptomyces caelestis TaxID=36816 RepID=A0A7W9HBB1_9ACTN|nr:carbohydrate ABC transporter permease [Streptomyces caelestis]MBB5798758.1 ABC-type glycerol-3-phosphate transport system permease component [Streptomyces caelestis]GGW85135.1 sugar ABC transporter permease [Streptomyces caelestis]